MKKIFFFFLILMAHVSAFDCTSQNCILLNQTDEGLITNLIYQNHSFPNHQFIKGFNEHINIKQKPFSVTYYSNGIIQNAWFKILTIDPSVRYKDTLYITNNSILRSEYNYDIITSKNYYSNIQKSGAICKIIHSLNSKKEYLEFDNIIRQKVFEFYIDEDSTIKGILNINAIQKSEYYNWNRYCCSTGNEGCRLYCYSCDHNHNSYTSYDLYIEDNVSFTLYPYQHNTLVKYISNYYNTTKAKLNSSTNNFKVIFENSTYKESNYFFTAEFNNQPSYLLQLTAQDNNIISTHNMYLINDTLLVKNANECSIENTNFFRTEINTCNKTYSGESIRKIGSFKYTKSWSLLFKLVIFMTIIYFIYVAIKKTWGRYLLTFMVMLPNVLADDCGLTNLASCIPEKAYNFFISVLNAPLQPLLHLVRTLLENPPSINIFISLWAIIIYCISLFYGLLFIYSGFQFLIAGHNVLKRYMAKEWLKNTVIMIVLVQASFYLYGLILEIGSMLTISVLSLTNEHFFLLTADNIANIGLEFFFSTFYVLILFITLFFLVIRYLIVSFGVVFAPIGIFCYFIPPLRSYGKLITNLLGMFIFITFLDAIVILACSQLIMIPLFENIKIVVMISCFGIVDLLFIVLTKHVITKSSISYSGEKVAEAVKYIAMFV